MFRKTVVWLIAISAFLYSTNLVFATATWTLSSYNSSLYREKSTATLLTSGKILVVGTPLSAYATEKYDPAAAGNPWSSSGSMTYGRYLHTADLVPYNGNGDMGVIVAGGYGKRSGGSLAVLKSTELYVEPSSWTEKANMNTARQQAASAVFGGKILVVGGYNTTDGVLADAEIYDPIANTWTPTATDMGTARTGAKAIAINNGNRVLVVGGSNSSGYLNTTEIYNVAHDSWSSGPTLSHIKPGGTLTALPNSKVLIAGEGYSQLFGSTYDSENDTYTNTLSSEVNMVISRRNHAAALVTLADDSTSVLVSGSSSGSSADNKSAELYNITNDSWASTTSMGYARNYHSATTVGGGTSVVVIGALYGQAEAKKAEIFTDP